MAKRIEPWQEFLRKHSAFSNALLIIAPSRAVNLFTLVSQNVPVVAMSAGFLARYSKSSQIVQAAIAHESGHIVAQDVERLLRIKDFIALAAISSVLNVVWLFLLHVWVTPDRVSVSYFSILPILVIIGISVSFLWSALVLARELQADSYAVAVLGSPGDVVTMLLAQLKLRQGRKDGPLQAIASWFIQPNLDWRKTLPGYRGLLGSRIEFNLGIGLAGNTITWMWAFALLSLNTYEYSGSATTSFGMNWLVIVPLMWTLYVFSWMRNRIAQDSLIRSLLSLFVFVFPSLLFMHIGDLFFSSYYEASGIPSANYYVLGASVITWAASKISMRTESEFYSDTPSVLRYMISWVKVMILSALLHVALSLVLPLPKITEMSQDSWARLAIPVLVGIWAHFFNAWNRLKTSSTAPFR